MEMLMALPAVQEGFNILNMFRLYAVVDGVVTFKGFFDNLTMVLLLITFFISIVLIAERLYYIWKKSKFNHNKVLADIQAYLENGDIDGAIAYLSRTDHPLHNTLKAGLENIHLPLDQIYDMMDSVMTFERFKLLRFTTAMGSIIAIAPLLGLFGTVDGLIDAFNQIAVTGSGGAEVVGKGISTALVTTWWGLIIAMMNIPVYNYVTNTAERILATTDVAARRLLIMISQLQHAE
ncbi:MAG: MotA/TolQ/ExbB proton channel family protein [Thermotogae bacterium]|nr:MotA/TolQ/ExbB proton channel family protein [Thermotogota bacterium]